MTASAFPQSISLTLTNHCNLRCQMCGQWSAEGYLRTHADNLRGEMTLADWKRVIDELAGQQIASLLLRGGEPFLFPHIVELLEYIHSQGIFIAIDTNGTMLRSFAADLVRISEGTAGIHLTVSVDGPEAIHDAVRGVPGCFQRIREGLAQLEALERAAGKTVSRSINFTISPYSVRGLGALPTVARELGIRTLSIVPYYYVPERVGHRYAEELRALGCAAFSWVGFHHEESGVDPELFQEQYRQFLSTLGEVYNYPYMVLSEAEYRAWFSDPLLQVGPRGCTNVEKLIDIQPNGDANFCVDYPDYTFGNVKEHSIATLWTGERAEQFRAARRNNPLAVCYRCGAKFMSATGG